VGFIQETEQSLIEALLRLHVNEMTDALEHDGAAGGHRGRKILGKPCILTHFRA
jgi:hypothetical protein